MTTISTDGKLWLLGHLIPTCKLLFKCWIKIFLLIYWDNVLVSVTEFVKSYWLIVMDSIIIPAKARDYGITGVGLSVCLFVCLLP